MKLLLEITPAPDIGKMRHRDGKLIMYQPYFHKLSNGNFQLRVVTESSNLERISIEAEKGNIYIPLDQLVADKS